MLCMLLCLLLMTSVAHVMSFPYTSHPLYCHSVTCKAPQCRAGFTLYMPRGSCCPTCVAYHKCRRVYCDTVACRRTIQYSRYDYGWAQNCCPQCYRPNVCLLDGQLYLQGACVRNGCQECICRNGAFSCHNHNCPFYRHRHRRETTTELSIAHIEPIPHARDTERDRDITSGPIDDVDDRNNITVEPKSNDVPERGDIEDKMRKETVDPKTDKPNNTTKNTTKSNNDVTKQDKDERTDETGNDIVGNDNDHNDIGDKDIGENDIDDENIDDEDIKGNKNDDDDIRGNKNDDDDVRANKNDDEDIKDNAINDKGIGDKDIHDKDISEKNIEDKDNDENDNDKDRKDTGDEDVIDNDIGDKDTGDNDIDRNVTTTKRSVSDKPGKCPPSSAYNIKGRKTGKKCYKTCNTDQSCPDNQKCCSHGCIKECVEPLTKENQCYFNGTVYDHDSWIPRYQHCRRCYCKDGRVRCYNQLCKPIHCPGREYRPTGECCSRCKLVPPPDVRIN